MDRVRKMKIWLSISVILVTGLFILSIGLFVFFIPQTVTEIIGEPGDGISVQRILMLSLRLYTRADKVSQTTTLNLQPKTFIARPGQTASEIALTLEEQDLITEGEDILLYWEYKGLDRFVRDGVYLIDPETPLLNLAERMATGETGYSTFAFLAGWRKEEVDNLLVQSGLIQTPPELILSDCHPDIAEPGSGIEGFLSPASYQVKEQASNQDIYCMFTDRFFRELPENFLSEINERGLNLNEAVTLASMIEKEMVNAGEAQRIAGVFYNRLSVDMPLQSDPTVQYAVASERGGPEWWSTEITKQDLKIDSPYNTYLNNGLPPAPICNPSTAALQAVIDPEMHDFLYFRAACDNSGQHVFSETYEAHLAAGCN